MASTSTNSRSLVRPSAGRLQSPATLQSAVEVRAVASRADRRRFVEFPWQVYADDPYWSPPLLREVYEFLDPRRQPFFKHGAAELYLAWRGDRVVGRIVASDDPNYNAEHGTNLGSFGMFECLDDPPAALALVEAAADWLRRRGRTAVMGPIDFSTNYNCGLLIEGFKTPQRVMMNHHRPYYQGLIEGCGLTKTKDLYAWWFNDADDMLRQWSRRLSRLRARGSITVRPARMDLVREELAKIAAVYNEAWEKNWGAVKMTPAEFEHQAHKLIPILTPELLLLAERDDQVIGFAMTLPDVNEALGPLNGRLTSWGLPLGLYRLYRNLKRIKTCRLITLGVLPQFRNRGVAEMLILQTLDHGKNSIRYTGAELSWTLEDNRLINSTIEKVGARRYKTYRIYEKPL